MKKKLFTLLFALVAIATTAQAQVVLNETNFPDANFRAALASILGISEGDEITAEKIAATTSLKVNGYDKADTEKISDLTGIEHFTALTYLSCGHNQLTSLDVSGCTALRELYCSKNLLTSLDVSQNTALRRLDCYGNQLASLNVLGCTALWELLCDFNQLTSLDVSGCTALTRFHCWANKIKGEGMDALVNSLPTVSNGSFIVVDTSRGEQNVCTTTQVAIAKEKGWTVAGVFTGEYEGSDPNIKAVVFNAENFPDANFRAALAGKFEISEGDEISETMVATTTSISVYKRYAKDSEKISDLTGIEHFTALTELDCGQNQLTSLDVSKNIALTSLGCSNNRLTSLDVSKNTALTNLGCSNNQLTSLDVSKNTALTRLSCYSNQLTSLDVSKNAALTRLFCYSNQIKGEAMDALVASLPTVEWGEFIVINTNDENEGNVCTKSQVTVAKGKGWMVYDYFGGGTFNQETWSYVYPEYEGSDPVEEDIDPVDEDDNIDFGSDMDENSDLDGNVIGDIFYNIGNGNGEYNAEEGCIVLKKTTNDETVDGLSGKDIFGEDFKGQFTGIVFKVPSGKGTVKVTAETTGNMLLKVKIGSNDPVEMELNGKLKISFPYNVSETTLVAIYAGANNEAKGFGTTNATDDAALKIYGIEFERDDTTAIGAPLNDNGKITNDNYYSIDGKKLSGEPTKKGIYIRNGRKIVK